MKPKRGETILDVGCSAGHFAGAMWRNNTVVGVDLSDIAMTRGRSDKNVNFVMASATNLPFKNSAFDKMSMLELIEHLPGVELDALREANRVLKRDGFLVMSTPNRGRFSQFLLLDPSSFVLKRHRHLSIQDLVKFLKVARFKKVNAYTGGLFAEQFAYLLTLIVEFSRFSISNGFRKTLSSMAFRGLSVYGFEKTIEAHGLRVLDKLSDFLWRVADLEFERATRSQSKHFYSIIAVASKT